MIWGELKTSFEIKLVEKKIQDLKVMWIFAVLPSELMKEFYICLKIRVMEIFENYLFWLLKRKGDEWNV